MDLRNEKNEIVSMDAKAGGLANIITVDVTCKKIGSIYYALY